MVLIKTTTTSSLNSGKLLAVGQVLGSTATNETIVVKAADLDTTTDIPTAVGAPGKWFFYNDTNDTINNALGSFVTGPWYSSSRHR